MRSESAQNGSTCWQDARPTHPFAKTNGFTAELIGYSRSDAHSAVAGGPQSTTEGHRIPVPADSALAHNQPGRGAGQDTLRNTPGSPLTLETGVDVNNGPVHGMSIRGNLPDSRGRAGEYIEPDNVLDTSVGFIGTVAAVPFYTDATANPAGDFPAFEPVWTVATPVWHAPLRTVDLVSADRSFSKSPAGDGVEGAEFPLPARASSVSNGSLRNSRGPLSILQLDNQPIDAEAHACL